MKNILIIGATSTIAEETARIWAGEGSRFYLLGRNMDKLKSIIADLSIRGAADSYSGYLEVNDLNTHEAAIDTAFRTLNRVDVILIAHGTLGDQSACEKDVALAVQELSTNALSTISLVLHIAKHAELQKGSTIAVITSVAGDRGRSSNYIYGAAKSAVSTLLEGLRGRLFAFGVDVIDIKPGLVSTSMTAHLDLPKLLVSDSTTIARCITRAIRHKSSVVYCPQFWQLIMFVVKAIPNCLFKRMKF